MINVANGLTAARLLLVPVVVYFLIEESYRNAFWTLLFCGLTDLLDGLFARWLRLRTVVGAYLDPIADKALLSTSFVVMAIVKIVPVWLAVIVITRDLVILLGSALLLLLDSGDEIRPTVSGKVNTALQLFAVYFLLLLRAYPGAAEGLGADAAAWTRYTSWGCAAAAFFSGTVYVMRGLRVLRGRAHPAPGGGKA
jgi:cardiolipin synthase